MKRELVNRPVCDLPAPKDIWGTTNDQSSIQFCCKAFWDQINFIEMLLLLYALRDSQFSIVFKILNTTISPVVAGGL